MATFDPFAVEFAFWSERVNPPRFQQLLGAVLPQHRGVALDAGCGPGLMSFYLAPLVGRVVGLDISPRMIAVARANPVARSLRNLEFMLGDLYQPPFSPGTFDLIASDRVLHDVHLETVLPALARLVRPSGWLVVRDLVTDRPERSTSPAWQALRTARQIPDYVRRYGARDAWRVVKFELDPAWLKHRCESEWMPAPLFQSLYSRYLPGCTFQRFGGAMAAFWQASG